MKICAVADLHGNLPELPESDLIIIAGDITPATFGYSDPVVQSGWINHSFAEWTHSLKCKELVYIAGNHDWAFEKMPDLIDHEGIRGHYLCNSSITLLGKKIWGSPWSPWFNDWAFNFPPGQRGQKQARDLWETIPEDVDIVVTHGPIYGYGDLVQQGLASPVDIRVGDTNLRDRLLRLKKLQLHVCGHIHEGSGIWQIKNTKAHTINATFVDETYVNTLPPTVINID